MMASITATQIPGSANKCEFTYEGERYEFYRLDNGTKPTAGPYTLEIEKAFEVGNGEVQFKLASLRDEDGQYHGHSYVFPAYKIAE